MAALLARSLLLACTLGVLSLQPGLAQQGGTGQHAGKTGDVTLQDPELDEYRPADIAHSPDHEGDPPGRSGGGEGGGGGEGSPVPEPTTLLLVGTGLLGLAISSRRWRRLSTTA